MSAPAPPLSNIATPSSLPIGVLITNPHDPFQDLHDSFPVRTALPAEITVTPFGIYKTNSTNSKISNLRSSLADILGLSRQCTKTSSSCLSAPEGERHQLTNHTQWFEAQCRDERTRHWIVDTWNKRNDIYLIVGLLVLTDANLVIESAMSKERGQQARISIPLGFTICNVVSSIGGVISAKDTRDSMDGNFEAPGKFVFGIWHRKIKVGWLQSRDLDNSRLASTTWKPLWRLRGEEKEAGIGEEGEVEEDDDEEDLIDLELEQESEWGSEDEESEHVRRSAATDLGQPNSLAPSLKRKSSQDDVGEVIRRPRMP